MENQTIELAESVRVGPRQLSFQPEQGQPRQGVWVEVLGYFLEMSALISLTEPTKDQVFAAYQRDLAQLEKWAKELRGFFLATIDAACTYKHGQDALAGKMKHRIPAPDKWLTIKLDIELASLSTCDLLTNLQDQYRACAEGLINVLAEWLDVLLETEQVGRIEWASQGVCSFSFFTFNRRVRETHREILTESLLTWRQHHLVQATAYSLAEYSAPKPNRVSTFLAATPDWLKPFIRVVDGLLVREFTHEMPLGISRAVRDPALCFGDAVLLGWTMGEVNGEQRLKREIQKEKTATIFWRIVGVLILLVVLFGVRTCMHHASKTNNSNSGAQVSAK